MKTLLITAAALALGTAAIAQDMNSATTPATTGADATQPTAATPPINPNPATDAATTGSMSTPTTATDPAMASPAPTTTTADTSMTAPASTTSMAAPASGGSDSYPVCSRKVTDRCIQKGAMRRR